MAPPLSAVQVNGAAKKTPSYTLDGLKKWAITKNELPNVEQIRSLHIYDFDNTLFATPLPNPQLWQQASVGHLMSEGEFTNGGWWHDPNVLAVTGKGIEVEEPRGWAGWWNEQIVELVKLSMQQQNALTVLLTGRAERGFGDIINRMVKSRGLEFDAIVLKPPPGSVNARPSTMRYKQAFLEYLVKTYIRADEIKIYEDRPGHVRDFRDFLKTFNLGYISVPYVYGSTTRSQPVKFEVIEVVTKQIGLDPLVEAAQVQRMIKDHNASVRDGTARTVPKPHMWTLGRKVFFFGYLIQPTDSIRLLNLAKLPTSTTRNIHTIANSVLITPDPRDSKSADKAGGIGAKLRWRVIAIGTTGNGPDQVWAARVEPVPVTTPFFVKSHVPHVVLAVRERAFPVDAQKITQWDQLFPSEQFEFDTTVGEKVLLKLEGQVSKAGNQNHNGKRPRGNFEQDFPALPRAGQHNSGGDRRVSGHAGGQGQAQRGSHGGATARAGRGAGRGARGQPRGGGGSGGISQRNQGGAAGGGGGSGRGRGNYGNYRSLDEEANARAARSFNLDGAADDNMGLIY